MMQQVYKTLPDDRPITGIQVVEDSDKCPAGFVVVGRTHDQDSDADLWREISFFIRRTRYLCLSKTEGLPNYIVESVAVLNEKELPPDGFCVISRTIDSDQKAWRKKQLCYRLSRRDLVQNCVTDIIILSRAKKAPSGFSLAGEINGLTVCFKTAAISTTSKPVPPSPSDLSYSISPAPPERAPKASWNSGKPTRPPPPVPATNGVHPEGSSPHEYERLMNLTPSRPAPSRPHQTAASSFFATLAAYNALEGVPFVLNTALQSSSSFQYPVIKAKTRYDLDKEYDYSFSVERQT
ncbi:multivesicular body subunit 12B [Bacillus rossius redtenbacheri]|uniref:multivesicular body subunit 12B n=1 Tax=Bacillus rossius redtenbacheri TaxID=93214 RepID=UPI002FDD1155